jgi:hypothetical protein
MDCRQGVSGGWYPGNGFWRQAAANPPPPSMIVSPLYIQRYPEIATMLAEPGINHVWRNVFFRCGPLVTGNRSHLDLMENGVFADQDPGFVDAAGGDYRLKPDAALFATVGFRPIPVEEIGLYKDTYRASWPVVTTPVAVPEWRKASAPGAVTR